MTRVILLHGKDKTAKDIWYPWLKNELVTVGIPCEVPDLPRTHNPRIAEWLGVLDSLQPDQGTILVGHSRGGMAILRWLETRRRKVAKVVLVATNSANIADEANSDFYSGPYDYSVIRGCCTAFVVMHSKDDVWVPYTAALENANGLHAKLISFDDRIHFGKQPDGSTMTSFPELLQEIV